MEVKIKKGNHYSNEWKIKPLFTKSYKRTIVFHKNCAYDASQVITLDGEWLSKNEEVELTEQVNKLCGFTLFYFNLKWILGLALVTFLAFCFFYDRNYLPMWLIVLLGSIFVASSLVSCFLPHGNSVRVGWRYNKEHNNIDLFKVEWKDGKMDYRSGEQSICSVEFEKPFFIEINKCTLGEVIRISKDKNHDSWLGFPIKLDNKFNWIIGFELGFYFGGNISSPHDLTIDITK